MVRAGILAVSVGMMLIGLMLLVTNVSSPNEACGAAVMGGGLLLIGFILFIVGLASSKQLPQQVIIHQAPQYIPPRPRQEPKPKPVPLKEPRSIGKQCPNCRIRGVYTKYCPECGYKLFEE